MQSMKIALGGYIVLLVLQLVAFFINHVLPLLAMAFESLASIIIAVILFAIYVSRKPADEFQIYSYPRNLAKQTIRSVRERSA